MDSSKDNIVTAASVRVRVEIISVGNDCLYGVLHSKYLDTPYVFSSLLQMIEKMEEIFDAKGFPEAFMSPRTFGTSKHSVKKHREIEDNTMKDLTNASNPPDSGGPTCTFEINVKFRQNATWQGQILWAERNLKQNFRSVLEMLKLMDEALAESDSKSEPIEWTGDASDK